MYCEVLASFLIIMFWFSLSLTEGWKWRQNAKKEDNNFLITQHTYHAWRAVTNGIWLCLPALMLYMNDLKIIFILLFANCVGWIVYERTMAFVEFDKVMAKKPEFYFLGRKFKRYSSEVEVAFGFGAFVLLTVNIFALR